jgi:regulator of protease activity HflC (stomatin/prohibitin superfamily)
MAFVERAAVRLDGFLMVLVGIVLLAGLTWGLVNAIVAADAGNPLGLVPVALGFAVVGVLARGFRVVQPNESRVLLFLGRYVGSLKTPGFHWVNPFATVTSVSLRVRNFQSERQKVNDASGNPIEIAAVIVWSVVDAARATLEVEAYESFVSIQAESALRALATRYPYDDHDGELSLRGSPEEIATHLQEELEQKLQAAGVQIHDARITHLAYAPEIAQAMLRRQQAQAVIAARKQIVEGAVTMVQMALERLAEHNVVQLDEERKANMVSNLMVVLVSESDTQPVINAGTLY